MSQTIGVDRRSLFGSDRDLDRRVSTESMDRRQARILPLAWLAAALLAGPTQAEPPPEIVRRLEAAVSDMNKGRPADAHEKFRALLERTDPPLQRELEARLKKKKIDGSLGDVTARLRVDVVNTGGPAAAKSLRPMGGKAVIGDVFKRGLFRR